MAAKVILALLALVTGTNAWLGEYACENVIQFGSRADVEQCFQDKFPSPVAEIFLKCAQNSHVSRAYTVLQDYCQYGRFQDEINNCMNQEEDITLVTQNVAFRTLRTCLDWLPRSIPDESSESGEDSGRAIRKRDTDNNEIDTDEKAPKEEEKTEESPEKGEETVNDQTVVVTEQAEPSLVTEIINVIDTLTEAPTEVGNDEDVGEHIDLDVKPEEVVNDKTNDIPAEDIEGPHSHEENEEAKSDEKVEDEAVKSESEEETANEEDKEEGNEEEDNEDEDDQDEEQGDSENVEDEGEGEENEGDENGVEDDNEENEEAGDGEDDEDNPSEESETDDDNDLEDQEEDEGNNSSEELDTDDDDSSANEDDEDNSSTNEDTEEDIFNYDYPFDFFESSEEDRSHELINTRYNSINFAIYINKK